MKSFHQAGRIVLGLLLPTLFLVLLMTGGEAVAQRRTLYWGTYGRDVRLVQWRLQSWGYYRGPIDGIFGSGTSRAVRRFQARNGLRVDGIVGPRTWAALGYPTRRVVGARFAAYRPTAGVARSDELGLLARVVAGEARGEPYTGQVAVAAIILNRVRSPKFPNTISGVIFQPGAFESVSNGLIWRRTPNATEIQAARDALNGWDPTMGALFFWNPAKPVSGWIWSRPIVVSYGRHVFAR
ncbi:MAG TPA: spore cortex-lytic enzyme [Firmicutes bacterium]|nr:spore cortex-lytic enzyme [Bacillota bacterium]